MRQKTPAKREEKRGFPPNGRMARRDGFDVEKVSMTYAGEPGSTGGRRGQFAGQPRYRLAIGVRGKQIR